MFTDYLGSNLPRQQPKLNHSKSFNLTASGALTHFGKIPARVKNLNWTVCKFHTSPERATFMEVCKIKRGLLYLFLPEKKKIED